ncbi:MAG: efflux RND transporter permease subunit [Polyangiaceae bacterium]
MQWLARICVQRPVFAWVLMLVVLVAGAFGYGKLGVDEFPNIDFPVVVVVTRLPGAAAEEVEADITEKIEGAVGTISGIEELRSNSTEGVSQVVVQFNLDKPIDVAAQDIRDKINEITVDLPKGIDPPTVTKIDPDATPVVLLGLRGDKSLGELSEYADKVVRRRVESLRGVGQVTLIGAQKREVHVKFDVPRMTALGITVPEVQRTIQSQNLQTPGGSLETGPVNVSLRVAGRVDSVRDLGDVVIRDVNGSQVRIRDVASVEDTIEDAKTWAELDGGRTVILAIRKQSGENTVEVVDTILGQLANLREGLPKGIELEMVRDNSQVVRTGIHSVQEHLVVGAGLAALVVLVFLGSFRTTFIAAIAIPISIIGTFAVMFAAGFSLNSLTLLALALAVGIVIDDAIVVLENIVRYVEEKHVKPFPAAVMATKEIGPAVLATTLSLCAVFLPVAAMPGIPGRFLKSFGLTMAFAVLVSLFVSFTLTPMLAARLVKAVDHDAKPSLATRAVDAFYKPIESVYMKLLGFSLRHRWVIVVASVLALFSLGPIMKRVPGGFIPQEDRAQFEISLRTQEGTSIPETRNLADRVASQVREFGNIRSVLVTVGEGAQQAPNVAKVYVNLTDPKQRTTTQMQIMDAVRKQVLTKLPADVRGNVNEVQAISTGAAAQNTQIAIQGPDLKVLAAVALDITKELKKFPGAVDVDTSYVVGKPEVRVSIDRPRAASMGVQVADVANTLGALVGGVKVGTYAESGEQYDIRVRALQEFRSSEADIGLVTVPSSKFGAVPLLSIVDVKKTVGPSQIERLNRQRQVTLMANAAPGVGDSTVQAELQRLIQEKLPSGYAPTLVGRTKETARMGKGFLLVFALAFIFMYLVLAAQFESWLHPATILVSLPLTVPFAMASLLFLGQSINIFSGLGLLVLFGVVKKNAILQVDHTNQLRHKGMERFEALMLANKDRLRPILMTTLAFVAGMIPLMLSRGIGAGKNQNTGAIIFGGQTFSLLLTLLAVPVFYSLFDDVSLFFGRLFKGKARDRGESDLQAMLEPGAPGAVHEPAE